MIKMWSGRNYNPDGGFKEYEWTEEKEKIGGVKVLSNPNAKRDDLPYHSNTSEAYFKRDSSGEIIQLRVYTERRAYLDIDINPSDEHTNKKTGEVFAKHIVHVHEWVKTANGSFRRSKEARLMSDAEIKKWGNAIKLANPNVKFKP